MIWGVPVFTFHLSVCNIPPPLRSSQRRNGDNRRDTACRVRQVNVVICPLYSVICTPSTFSPCDRGSTTKWGGGMCIFHFPFSTFRFPFSVYIIPPPPADLSNVALGSAPLRGHRMTFSHSSKDPLRPLSQGEKVSGHLKPESTPHQLCPSESGGRARSAEGYVKNYER